MEVESNADRDAFYSYFQLDCRLEDLAARLIRAAPALAEPLVGRAGLRLCRPQAADETFFCFLCTANNHLSRITTMVRTLESYGKPLGPGLLRFPSPSEIARLEGHELRMKGFGYRGASVPLAAAALASRGPRWLQALRLESYEVAHQALVAIPSIGPKLADCIALYGLHQDRAVPVDTHLWQAACRSFFPEFAGRSLTARRYREIGDQFRERFGEDAGWAQLYLYADNMARNGKPP